MISYNQLGSPVGIQNAGEDDHVVGRIVMPKGCARRSEAPAQLLAAPLIRENRQSSVLQKSFQIVKFSLRIAGRPFVHAPASPDASSWNIGSV